MEKEEYEMEDYDDELQETDEEYGMDEMQRAGDGRKGKTGQSQRGKPKPGKGKGGKGKGGKGKGGKGKGGAVSPLPIVCPTFDEISNENADAFCVIGSVITGWMNNNNQIDEGYIKALFSADSFLGVDIGNVKLDQCLADTGDMMMKKLIKDDSCLPNFSAADADTLMNFAKGMKFLKCNEDMMREYLPSYVKAHMFHMYDGTYTPADF